MKLNPPCPRDPDGRHRWTSTRYRLLSEGRISARCRCRVCPARKLTYLHRRDYAGQEHALALPIRRLLGLVP